MDALTLALLAGAGVAGYMVLNKKTSVNDLLTRVKEPVDGGDIMADVTIGDIASTISDMQDGDLNLKISDKDGERIKLSQSIYSPTLYTYGGKGGTVISVMPFALKMLSEDEAKTNTNVEKMLSTDIATLNQSVFTMPQRKLDESIAGKADKQIGNLIQRITIKGFTFPKSSEEEATTEQQAMAAMIAFLRKGDSDIKILARPSK